MHIALYCTVLKWSDRPKCQTRHGDNEKTPKIFSDIFPNHSDNGNVNQIYHVIFQCLVSCERCLSTRLTSFSRGNFLRLTEILETEFVSLLFSSSRLYRLASFEVKFGIHTAI